jgi:hypothetical protein
LKACIPLPLLVIGRLDIPEKLFVREGGGEYELLIDGGGGEDGK